MSKTGHKDLPEERGLVGWWTYNGSRCTTTINNSNNSNTDLHQGQQCEVGLNVLEETGPVDMDTLPPLWTCQSSHTNREKLSSEEIYRV